MKSLDIFVFLLFFLVSYFGHGQKHPIDAADFTEWRHLDESAISPDGSSVKYTIRSASTCTAILHSLISDSAVEIPNLSSDYAFYANSSKYLLYTGQNDTLHRINTLTFEDKYLTNVSSFLSTVMKSRQLLLLYSKAKGEIRIQQIDSSIPQITIGNVVAYWLDEKHHQIWISKVNGILTKYDFKNKLEVTVWKGQSIVSLWQDELNGSIAFTEGNAQNLKIWYYKPGMSEALLILGNNFFKKERQIRNIVINRFSADGNFLLLSIVNEPQPPPSELSRIGINVDVWTYNDVILPCYQQKSESQSQYTAVLDIQSKSVKKILDTDEIILMNSSKDWLLVQKNDGYDPEAFWTDLNCSRYLFNFVTGKKIELVGMGDAVNSMFSISNDFFIYLSRDRSIVNSVCLNNGKTFHLFKEQSFNDYSRHDGINAISNEANYPGVKISRWINNESKLLVIDSYDVWQLSLDNSHPPLCLTNQIGRKNQISFEMLNDDESTISQGSKLLLKAIDYTTLQSGIFQLDQGWTGLKKLTMEKGRFRVTKAKNRQIFLIKRETFTEPPNLFITKDFKKFASVSEEHPNQNIEWSKDQLMTWKNPGGDIQKAILFHPESFDSTKKYPVIIHYYERKATEIAYSFPNMRLGFVGAGVEPPLIPWFTSRGYLVFFIDIKYTNGYTGRSALNSVNQAVDQLNKLRYVDSSKLALQGHSFGGYQTNYILSKSKRFAAAISSCGLSDFVSWQGGLKGTTNPPQVFAEHGQLRLGQSFAARPEIYIENSPVFYVQNISAPLLIIQNANDYKIPFEQGTELFLTMRRAGKKVWMLQYDKGSHDVAGLDAIDYNFRMEQFLAHYLKGAPAPIWMTRGIAAKDKGIKTGYEYDTEIKTPGPGLITEEEGKLIEENSKIPLWKRLKEVEENN